MPNKLLNYFLYELIYLGIIIQFGNFSFTVQVFLQKFQSPQVLHVIIAFTISTAFVIIVFLLEYLYFPFTLRYPYEKKIIILDILFFYLYLWVIKITGCRTFEASLKLPFIRSWFHTYCLVMVSKKLFTQALRLHLYTATSIDYLLQLLTTAFSFICGF